MKTQPTPPAVSRHFRAMQLKGAAAIAGTPAAKIRSTHAARSVSPEAARLRSAKALAARWGKPSVEITIKHAATRAAQ
jgi:hypothetical protein